MRACVVVSCCVLRAERECGVVDGRLVVVSIEGNEAEAFLGRRMMSWEFVGELGREIV